jgi:hypothetical protein
MTDAAFQRGTQNLDTELFSGFRHEDGRMNSTGTRRLLPAPLILGRSIGPRLLLAKIGSLKPPPGAMANVKHLYPLLVFQHAVDHAIDVRLATVEKVPES